MGGSHSNHRIQMITMLGGLLTAFVIVAVITQVLVGGLAVLLGLTHSMFEVFLPAVIIVLVVWTVMLAGSVLRLVEVKAGGAVVARRLGAVQASNRSRFQSEKALIHVVSAIAIASGCKRPSVFVLRDEWSINSLILGSFSGDTALVITQGALESLTRDELAIVIAHECHHIVRGEVPERMRFMVALAGLLALDQMGRRLVSKGIRYSVVHPYCVMGKLLRVLGSVGVVTSYAMIKQRSSQTKTEADVKATHIVRQTQPLISVLGKIKQSQDCNVALKAYFAGEVKHLCFHAGNWPLRPTFLNANKPSLDDRAQVVNSLSAIPFNDDNNKSSSNFTASNLKAKLEPVQKLATAQLVSGTPTFNGRGHQNKGLSERAIFLMPDVESSLAALFALFLPSDESKKARYLSSVAFAYNQKFSALVNTVARGMPQDIVNERLAVIEFATAKIRTGLPPSVYRPLLLNLERLINAQGLNSLMSYAAMQHIRTKLSANFPTLKKTAGKKTPNAKKRLLKPIENMGEELALLISLVLESTTLRRHEVEREYVRVLDCYSEIDYPRRTAKESGIIGEVEAAYQLMLMQPHRVRDSFVKHCIQINKLDPCVTGEQHSLMQVFIASLGCSAANENTEATEPLLCRSA